MKLPPSSCPEPLHHGPAARGGVSRRGFRVPCAAEPPRLEPPRYCSAVAIVVSSVDPTRSTAVQRELCGAPGRRRRFAHARQRSGARRSAVRGGLREGASAFCRQTGQLSRLPAHAFSC
jgi:hypothetical protein